MQIGYMRVSKADGSQVLDLQRDALIAAGIDPAHIYEDMASGAKDDRPGLTACLKSLRKGDVLVIWKLDRLGRNLKYLIEVTEDLNKRGVGFKVLQGAPVDTTTSQGKLMFAMFVALAEFERDVIRERTLAGLAVARARGRKGGRRHAFTPSKLRRAAAAMASRDTHVTDLCEELGVSRATLHNYVTADGKFTARGEALLAPAPKAEPKARVAKELEVDLDLVAFVTRTKRLIAGKSQRALEGKLAIASAFNLVQQAKLAGPGFGDIGDFKQHLVLAARKGWMELERVDIAGVLSATQLAESQVQFGRDLRHLIVTAS